MVGVAGIATLVLSGTGTADGTGVIGAGAVVPLAFAGFCVSDVAHDCLLGPGRALAGDQAASDKERAGAHAMFSGMQMLGRFLAMVLGSLPLKRLVAHARAGVAVHMQVLMAISGGVLLLCSLLAVLARPSLIPSPCTRFTRAGIEWRRCHRAACMARPYQEHHRSVRAEL